MTVDQKERIASSIGRIKNAHPESISLGMALMTLRESIISDDVNEIDLLIEQLDADVDKIIIVTAD